MSFFFSVLSFLHVLLQLDLNSILEWNNLSYSYTDLPSRNDVVKTESNATMDSAPDSKGILQQGLAELDGADDHSFNDSDSDSDSDSDYLFDAIKRDEESDNTKKTREREQVVLEAAGLVVNQDVKPPPKKKRRPAPPIPQSVPSRYKDLHQLPGLELELDREVENVEASLDDAFARYESFRNNQSNLNRFSVISADSGTLLSSPTSTIPPSPMSMTLSHSGGTGESSSRYSHFLQFLKSGNKTPEGKPKSVATLNISAPIMNQTVSNQSTMQSDVPSRSDTPSFGMVRSLRTLITCLVLHFFFACKVLGQPGGQNSFGRNTSR